MSAANLNLRWAELLIDGLAAAGVREAVVSPGSRSTPLALAIAGERRLRAISVVDERDAAFFALGQARASGRPSLLVCTSGSAGAHYLPAVIEAAEAGVPLLVCTADRPPELQGRQAPQTTWQLDLLGRHARAVLALGTPDAAEAALIGIRQTGILAVARTLDPEPGPVHLNAPFRKPLEPEPESDAVLDELVRAIAARPATRVAAPRRVPDAALIDDLAAACRRAARPVVLAGPAPLAEAELRPLVGRLSARLGAPLLAEAASQLRFGGDGADLGLFELLAPGAGAPDALRPDLVLQLGAPPVSAAWGRSLERSDAPERWVLGRHGWNDPFNRAAGIVHGEPDLTLLALLAALGEGPAGDEGWLARWRAAEAVVATELAAAEEEGRAAGELSEAQAARAVLAALPSGATLSLANSLSVREVDLVCPGGPTPLQVLAQRGVNGIDGTVASGAGAASVLGRPLILLCGDLALLHDLGGLATLRHVTTPLVIVVLHNDGGRLFELLPLAERELGGTTFRDLFLTPHGLSFAGAAEMFGLPFHPVADRAALDGALAAALARAGASLIEARIHGTAPRARRLGLRERVRAALAR